MSPSAFADHLRSWAEGPGNTLRIRFGPCGGGQSLASWIGRIVEPAGGAIEVVDGSTADRVGAGDAPCGGRRIVLTSADHHPSDAEAGIEADDFDLRDVLHELLLEAGVSAVHARTIADRCSPATRLADELRLARPADDAVLGFVWGRSTVHRLASEVAGDPWKTLELGRVVLLLDPHAVAVSDEWPALASRLADTPCTVSDLSRLILNRSWLFATEDVGGQAHVRIRNPLARELLGGLVPLSGSEHLSLYKALRDRAMGSLVGRDHSDQFIRASSSSARRGGGLPAPHAGPSGGPRRRPPRSPRGG